MSCLWGAVGWSGRKCDPEGSPATSCHLPTGRILNFSFLIWACVLNHLSHVQLFVTPWTVACQAPLSMGFSRQEYWSGWPCPLPGDFPSPGVESMSLMYPALVSRFFTTGAPWEAPFSSVKEEQYLHCVGLIRALNVMVLMEH